MPGMTAEEAKKRLGLLPNGQLSPCPDMPNCICSQYANDPDHYAEPMRFKGSVAEAKNKLKKLLLAMSRVTLADESERYLRFEFTSLIFRFIDDVEFVFDEKAGTIHFRSASRVGYSDLGANSSRIKEIRASWEKIARGV